MERTPDFPELVGWMYSIAHPVNIVTLLPREKWLEDDDAFASGGPEVYSDQQINQKVEHLLTTTLRHHRFLKGKERGEKKRRERRGYRA